MQTFRPLPPATGAEKKKRKPNRKALLFLSVFFIALLIAGYIRSPLSRLQSVSIEGNRQISVSAILAQSGLVMKMNVWKIRPHEVEDTLLRHFPLFSSVHVRYQFPDRVVIQVQEKQTVGLFMSQGKFYHMLNEGTLLDEVPTVDGNSLPIIVGKKSVQAKIGAPVNDPQVVALAKELAAVPDGQLSLFSDFQAVSSTLWIAHTLDGFQVEFDPGHVADKLSVVEDFHKKLVDSGTKPGIINVMDRLPYYSKYDTSEPNKQNQKGAS